MAKNKVILFNFLFVVCCIGLFGQHSAITKVRDVYTAEIGVREATGHNDGTKVEQYLAITGIGKGNAWCAAFVAWTYQQSNVKSPLSAWSPAWFPNNRTIYTRGQPNNLTPQTADVFGIYYPSKKRVAHVGFIDDWPNGNFAITVEGNTNDEGSREGDGVYKKRRLKSQIYKVSRWIN